MSKMTRKLLFLVLLLFLLVFVASVNAETTTTTRDAAAKLKQQMQLLQEQKKATVSNVRGETKATMQAKRDEFNTRITAIKDQKKKVVVERIDTKLAEVNKNHTARFTDVLSKLQGLVDKFNQSATGTTVLTDVTAAQAAIDAAKAAVEAQAAKSYVMTISDEATLKINVGATVSQLRLDLMAAHKMVVDAKQAVQKLRTDKAAMKKEATPSASL